MVEEKSSQEFNYNPKDKEGRGRAFSNSEIKPSEKKCYICAKSFGIMSRGKECSLCSRFICKEHNVKTSTKIGLCILCEIQQIKSKRQKEILNEINKLTLQNKISEEELARHDAEKQEKMRIIEEIENQLIANERSFQEEERKLNIELLLKSQQGEVIRKAYQEMTEKCNESTKQEKEFTEEKEILELKICSLQHKIIDAKDRKQKSGLELEYINNKLLAGLSKNLVKEILCKTCMSLLNSGNPQAVIDEGSVKEEDNLEKVE